MINTISQKRGRNGKLTKMANERGVPLEQLITDSIKSSGSIAGAARHLSVTANTLHHYLKRFGYATVINVEVAKHDPRN